MTTRLRLFALLALTASAAFAQFDMAVIPPQVELSGSVTKRTGDRVEGVAEVMIPAPWHVNSAKPLDDFAIPTVLTLDPSTATLVSAQYPPHEIKTFAFSAGSKVAVYQGKIAIPFVATLAPGAKAIKASLRYQSCNDKVCLPPKTVSASIALDVTGGGAGANAASPSTTSAAAPAATASTPISSAPAAEAPPSSGGAFTPLDAAPKNGAVPAAAGDKLASTFAASGLPLTLAILFVLGIALNLTPCVFPMIPITMGFFAMQSDGRRSRRFALSALYVFGIVIMYSSLGVVASLGGKMFGAWLQQPAVQVGFAALMLVLASSMFGAFDITVPQFIANRAMGRAGLAGAMTMGLLVGIVAAPCVGPVVVSLITLVASIGKPVIGFVMFAALALGLGFPYLALLNALPRPGEWMVQVKKAMGFVLVAMAVYFLRPLIGETWFHAGVAVSLLVGAVFLFLKTGRSEQARALRIACASILLVAGIAFALPRLGERSALTWQSYDQANVLGSVSSQPVVIDFFADWCIPCKELDAKTFSDKSVAQELGRFKRVKADLSLPDDPKTRELTRRYHIVGVPTIVFLDSKGEEIQSLRLTGFEAPEQFLQRARQAR